jgi:hypothetical protein
MGVAVSRDILIETDGGPRVALGKLFASFTPRERCRWFQWAGIDLSMDEFGILPGPVERFLETLDVKRQMELV